MNIKDKKKLGDLIATISVNNSKSTMIESLKNGIERFIDEKYALNNIPSSAVIIRWVPVSENIPPEQKSDVIVKLNTSEKKYAFFDTDNRFYDNDYDDITDEVESYMSIPD
jgi:hypothetical protein